MRKLGIVLVLLWSYSLAAQPRLVDTSISELQLALSRGDTTSVELVQAYLNRIAAYDRQGPQLNSIVRINPEALAEAARLDAERQAGQLRGPLHGIPVLVKDNYNTDFMPTTGGSVALASFVPSRNATQVDKLIAAGAIVLAKTNLHEYAYGITTIGSLAGQTRNPYDLRRVPGGSSGGTAAAVAASFAAVGMGSDTCGSIRIPSTFNNLVGLRPSKGLSSIFGIMPLSHTQDVGGPLARSTADLAAVLDATVGPDANDPATRIVENSKPVSFSQALGSVDVASLRIGRLESYMNDASPAVRNPIDAALDWFVAQGAEIVSLEIDNLDALLAASGLIGHEFKPDLNQYLALFLSTDVANLNDIVDQGLYHEAVGGALRRSQASVSNPEAYERALTARETLRSVLQTVFADNDLDAIAYPPIAELPVMIGNPQPGNNCSISANSGLPAIAVPLGLSDAGLPVAMELLGDFMQDAQLVAIAHAWEQAQAPRQAPTTTPELIAGAAPGPVTVSTSIRQGRVDLRSEVSFDPLRNRLTYAVQPGSDHDAQIYALTLLVAEDQSLVGNSPIVLNLLGPQQNEGQGEYYMSPQFRQAFLEARVYYRVFAEGLPVTGYLQVLQP